MFKENFRERESNAFSDEVLVATVSKLRNAEKNKTKAMKEWHRDREDKNDQLLARIKQNKMTENAKQRERIFQLKDQLNKKEENAKKVATSMSMNRN